jgi:hypothetical protein
VIGRLVWKLTFAHLSGSAIAAHIHLGWAGKAGNVVVPLCGNAKCKSGVHGSATLTAAVLKALTTDGTYVNVHTAKNRTARSADRSPVASGSREAGIRTPTAAPLTPPAARRWAS